MKKHTRGPGLGGRGGRGPDLEGPGEMMMGGRHGRHGGGPHGGEDGLHEFGRGGRGRRGEGGLHELARGGRGGGRGPGRIFGHGDLRLVLLALIGEQPRYGYELIKAIEDQFGGAYAPSPGSIYPTLTLLDETGLIAGTAGDDGKKKRFATTEAGRAYLAEHARAVESVKTRMAMTARALAGERPPPEVFHAIQILRTALELHRGAWDEAEVGRVSSIIERAAREIDAGRG